jgi:nucleotide-binding universal stress UspA family protein
MNYKTVMISQALDRPIDACLAVASDLAERLDRMAANFGAGVVIAGAHGYSRFREWILGRVTHHLAKNPSRFYLVDEAGMKGKRDA